MKFNKAITEIKRELFIAEKKFPLWPVDPIHAGAIVNEENGELQQACLQAVYEPTDDREAKMKSEAIQTAAMAIRFLCGMKNHSYITSEQVTVLTQ